MPGISSDAVDTVVALACQVSAAREWARRGPRLVVLTQGARGATAWLRGQADVPIVLPAMPVHVVDTVGAGDAFMAGLLSGLLDAGLIGAAAGPEHPARTGDWRPDDVRPALLRALRVSALTCTRPGADPPRRAELTGGASLPHWPSPTG